MQTLEFVRALAEITNELKAAAIVNMLEKWLSAAPERPISEAEKDTIFGLFVDSQAGYQRLRSRSDIAMILLGLDIQEFLEPSRMRRFTNDLSSIPNSQHMKLNVGAWVYMEKFRSLIKITGTAQNLLEFPKVLPAEPGDMILVLQMIDYNGKGIEPERLVLVVELLIGLHKNLARLLGVEDEKFTFKYFDSGSDLTMALEGGKAVLEKLAPLFQQFWNKIAFHKQNTFEKNIEALTKGLEFLDTLQESVEKKSLSSDEAANLKTRIFRDIDTLLGLGVSLPLKDNAPINQRDLLSERRARFKLVLYSPVFGLQHFFPHCFAF